MAVECKYLRALSRSDKALADVVDKIEIQISLACERK